MRTQLGWGCHELIVLQPEEGTQESLGHVSSLRKEDARLATGSPAS